MTMKQLKGSTVGDLLKRVEQPYCYDDPRRSRARNGSRIKREEQQDKKDIFSMQYNNSINRQVKLQQVKREHDVKNEYEGKKSVCAKTRRIVYMDDKFNKQLQLEVTFHESNFRPAPKNLDAADFNHNTIWDTERLLYKHNENSEQGVTIPSLVELPQDKKKLNKPAEYHPIGEPKKKKMYKPAVPKVFYSGYDVYLDRRKKVKPQKDLAVLSLDEIVEECYNRKLIPLDIYTRFMNLNGTLHILKNFIEKWTSSRIHQYDFNRTPFTLLDHRRLSQLLMNFFPTEYTLGTVDAFHIDEKQFLTRVYFINYQEYIKCYMILDNISGCKWWQEIKARYKNTKHYYYFSANESLTKKIIEIENFQSKEVKSECIRKIIGPLDLQDGEAELDKILSNKFKNSPREFSNEETMSESESRLGQFSGTGNEMDTGVSNYGNYGQGSTYDVGGRISSSS